MSTPVIITISFILVLVSFRILIPWIAYYVGKHAAKGWMRGQDDFYNHLDDKGDDDGES